MNPSLLLPPVKPNEAVAIADLLFGLTHGRPWSNDIRGRFTSSLPTLSLGSLTAYPQTLVPDPNQPGTFFLVVLSRNADGPSHWLLHMAPASAPTTPLFPKPILLARFRPNGEREVIINTVPLEANLTTFIRTLHPQILARATNIHNLWSLPVEAPLDGFLTHIPKRGNILPAFRATQSSWQAYKHILLSSWRDGFVNILEGLTEVPTAEQAEPYSRFSYRALDPQDARAIADFHRGLKSTLPRNFDLELDLSQHPKLDLEQLDALLDNLKLIGVPLQSIEFHPSLEPFTAVLHARQLGLTLRAAEPGEPVSGLRTHWKLEQML